MFLRFAVVFLQYSENLRLVRGEKIKRVPENKKHQSETVCYREYPVAFGQKREKVGVGQSDTANTLSAANVFRYIRFWPLLFF